MNVEVQFGKTDLWEPMRRYIARRLHRSLGRFGSRVSRLNVRIVSSGQLHVARNQCYVSAEIVPFGNVTAQESSPDVHTAIDRATMRIGRLFAQELDRIRDIKVGRESIRAA